jgi:hypothetical protein
MWPSVPDPSFGIVTACRREVADVKGRWKPMIPGGFGSKTLLKAARQI